MTVLVFLLVMGLLQVEGNVTRIERQGEPSPDPDPTAGRGSQDVGVRTWGWGLAGQGSVGPRWVARADTTALGVSVPGAAAGDMPGVCRGAGVLLGKVWGCCLWLCVPAVFWVWVREAAQEKRQSWGGLWVWKDAAPRGGRVWWVLP